MQRRGRQESGEARDPGGRTGDGPVRRIGAPAPLLAVVVWLFSAGPGVAQEAPPSASSSDSAAGAVAEAPEALRPATVGSLQVFRGTRTPGSGTVRSETSRRGSPRPLLRASDAGYGGVFLGALLLSRVAPGLDRDVSRSAYHGDGGPDRWFYEGAAVLGNGIVDVALTGAAWAGGEVFGSERTSRVALRSLESVVASDLLAFSLKLGIGRQRPSSSSDPEVFRPGTLDREHFSFPSGHTAHVFALAATLSRELEAGWVPYVAYPVAGAVGISRVVGRRHWPTDVVAGAAVGLFSSHLVGRIHGGGDPDADTRITALVGPRQLALGVHVPLR